MDCSRAVRPRMRCGSAGHTVHCSQRSLATSRWRDFPRLKRLPKGARRGSRGSRMIKSAVTISLVSESRGGPFVFWDDLAGACKTAGELGFDAVEIFAPGPDAVDPVELRKLLADHKLSLAAVGTEIGRA